MINNPLGGTSLSYYDPVSSVEDEITSPVLPP